MTATTIARIGGFDSAAQATNGRIAGATHAFLRIAVGALFLQHGLQKLFGLLGGFMGTPGATAPLFSQMGLAGVLEFGGGILLIAGLLTRPVAIVLALEMIAAYFIAHLPQGGFPIQNAGEPALLFAAAFVFFAGNGAGPLSVDRWIGRRWAGIRPSDKRVGARAEENVEERRTRERRTRAA